MTDNASRESVNATMNDLIRRATGHPVAGSEDRSEEAQPPAGEADGGEGGVRDERREDMNAELRRATGRPGIVDGSGRAWS